MRLSLFSSSQIRQGEWKGRTWDDAGMVAHFADIQNQLANRPHRWTTGLLDDVIALLSYKEPIASLLYQHRLMGLAGVVAGLYAFLVVTHLICGFFFMIGLACVYGYEYWMRSRYTEVRSTGEWRQPRNWVVPVFATNLNVPGCSWR